MPKTKYDSRVKTPTEVLTLRGARTRAVACGYYHTALLCHKPIEDVDEMPSMPPGWPWTTRQSWLAVVDPDGTGWSPKPVLWVSGCNGCRQLWPESVYNIEPRVQRKLTHMSVQSGTGIQSIACTHNALVTMMDGQLWLRGSLGKHRAEAEPQQLEVPFEVCPELQGTPWRWEPSWRAAARRACVTLMCAHGLRPECAMAMLPKDVARLVCQWVATEPWPVQ